MRECTCSDPGMWWDAIDEIGARALVATTVAAARAQVDYSRAQTAARRCDALLGKNAGREHEYRAELCFEGRRQRLQAVKRAYMQFVGGLDEDQRKRVNEFLRAGGLKDVAANARRRVVVHLLDSDLAPEVARDTVKTLDGRLDAIAKLTTFDKLNAYASNHIDELIAKKFGNPSALYGLCVLILIITSVFAVIVLVAAIICALTFGLACEGLLERLLEDACT